MAGNRSRDGLRIAVRQRPSRAIRLGLVLTWAALVPAIGAQEVYATGFVRSRATGLPVANALVRFTGLPRPVFTDTTGRFRLLAGFGSRQLQVRRIGYAPVDTAVNCCDNAIVILVEPLRALSPVVVNEISRCTSAHHSAPGDTGFVSLMAQVRMNAEQLRMLSSEYPFESRMEIVRATKPRGTNALVTQYRDTIRLRSESRWTYRPGRVVTGRNPFVINVPTLRDIASEAFVQNHCFVYAGPDTAGGRSTLRVDFTASDLLRTPDVNGSIHVDPSTFQVRRTVFHLSSLPAIRGLMRYEVITDYQEIAEAVPIICHIFSRQTFDVRAARDQDFVFEEWTLVGFRFLERSPGRHIP